MNLSHPDFLPAPSSATGCRRHGIWRPNLTKGVICKCMQFVGPALVQKINQGGAKRSGYLGLAAQALKKYMEYERFLHQQWQYLYDEWIDHSGHNYIAFHTDEQRKKSTSKGWPGDGGRWANLGGCDPDKVQVYHGPGGEQQLWVRPVDKTLKPSAAYRRHWRKFVRSQEVQEPYTYDEKILPIDHLFPETAAARAGIAWVRITAVKARSNALVSFLEKKRAAKNEQPRPHTADYITMIKVTGFEKSLKSFANGRDFALQFVSHLESCQQIRTRPFEDIKLEIELIAHSFERAVLDNNHGGIVYL